MGKGRRALCLAPSRPRQDHGWQSGRTDEENTNRRPVWRHDFFTSAKPRCLTIPILFRTTDGGPTAHRSAIAVGSAHEAYPGPVPGVPCQSAQHHSADSPRPHAANLVAS